MNLKDRLIISVNPFSENTYVRENDS